MENSKGVNKVIRGYEKEFEKNISLDEKLRLVRENFKKEGETDEAREKAIKELDRMEEEKLEEIKGCDCEIASLEGKLENLLKESDKIDRDTAKAIRWTIIIGAIAMGVVIIAAVKGWIA